jgi:hypothetical protein
MTIEKCANYGWIAIKNCREKIYFDNLVENI